MGVEIINGEQKAVLDGDAVAVEIVTELPGVIAQPFPGRAGGAEEERP